MITLEKRCKNNFLVQKMTPKLVVLHSLKKLQVSQKNQLKKKKYFQLICADKIFKKVSRNYFKINASQDIFTFVDFTVPKFALINIIIKNTRTKKSTKFCTQF